MPITEQHHNETWKDGQLLHDDVVEVDVTEQVVEFTLHDQADQALASLRTIANGTGTLTTAQLTTAVRGMARVLVVLVRLAIRRLDDVT